MVNPATGGDDVRGGARSGVPTLRHLLSILILPVTMMILVPAWILHGQDPPPTLPGTVIAWGLVLLGEAAALRSVPHLEWAVGFVLANAAYIPLVEERGLRSRFGSAYETYARNVPRLIPRLRGWKAETAREDGEDG
jgi:protein-S-isoprenylcysteine O-methyltransferase Ste14